MATRLWWRWLQWRRVGECQRSVQQCQQAGSGCECHSYNAVSCRQTDLPQQHHCQHAVGVLQTGNQVPVSGLHAVVLVGQIVVTSADTAHVGGAGAICRTVLQLDWRCWQLSPVSVAGVVWRWSPPWVHSEESHVSAHATSRPTINTTTGTQHRAASKQAFITNAVKLDYPFLSVVHIFLLGEHFWLIITLYYSPIILLVLTKAHTSDRPFIGALHQVRFIKGSRYMQFTMSEWVSEWVVS